MQTTYNPSEIEQRLYQIWEENGYFKPTNKPNAANYSIAIPPPNVTGSLHMGHAFQQTLMDILIRYHRMLGDNTLWQAGTDHAGIATQMVVERKIAAEEGKTKYDYGREAFIEKIWQWKEYSGNTISQQMRRLGNSIDWQRERFTMDDGLSAAVKEIFVRLYEDGLIYRGKRLVNWDPKLHTAISDLEVENKEVNGNLWYFRYPLADNQITSEGLNYLVVATTRPETMLGDTAVAVNPADPRYQDLVGKSVILPLVNRKIPIVADEYVDIEFGTGVVKITPAHDFNDYEVGKRHNLPMINVMTLDANIRQQPEVVNTDGTINDSFAAIIPENYRGLERFAARKQIIKELDDLGLLEKIMPHALKVPYGDRGGVPIEPMLTDQWYVAVQPLADKAIAAVEDGDIKFVPKSYENLYFSWMRDIKDWCISRQLWWGHRIPAWYDQQGNTYVGRDENEVRLKHNLTDNIVLKQDEDVLDTWFSSALWTFSTLGWPDITAELKQFHPTSVLITGFDIIFFWVARMIMFTLGYVTDDNGKPEVPFKDVYVTGLIRDDEGQKMSKSKGNVIDPLDMIDGISLEELLEKRTGNMMQPQLAEKIAKRTRKQFPDGIAPHGTDALRFTLASLASTGRDINWDMNRLTGYRNFCNKLWNASRYVIMNTEGFDCGMHADDLQLSLADQWIIAELQKTIEQASSALNQYRFDLMANAIYDFIWNQFCDWYLEFSKFILINGSAKEQQGTRHTLITTLETVLRLAHPIIPFITEEIWQKIKELMEIDAATIMLQPYPVQDSQLINNEVIQQIDWLKQLIVAIRNFRAEQNIALSKSLSLYVRNLNTQQQQCLTDNLLLIQNMAKLSELHITTDNIENAITKLVANCELVFPMAGFIDKQAELARLNKEIDKLQQELARIDGKLGNQGFVAKAPAEVIAKEQAKRQEFEVSLAKLQQQITVVTNLQ